MKLTSDALVEFEVLVAQLAACLRVCGNYDLIFLRHAACNQSCALAIILLTTSVFIDVHENPVLALVRSKNGGDGGSSTSLTGGV